jgi:prepilin-type N-terminal cleavage/methylation domain-containing protein
MSGLAAFAVEHRDRLRSSRHRAQHGYTLIEVLLVVAISGLILGPLFAWMILAMRQQPIERDGMIVSAQAGLLRGNFPRDVTVAGGARVHPLDPAELASTEWGTWSQPCQGSVVAGGAGVRPLVVLVSQGVARSKTIYTLGPARDGSTVLANQFSLWRTECSANTGLGLSERQIVDNVSPDAARTFATCAAAVPTTPPDPNLTCRSVTLTAALLDSNQENPKDVVLTATRRTDLQSLTAPTTGNYLPTPLIDIESQGHVAIGSPAGQVVLNAGLSSDAEDGTALTYLWDLPVGSLPAGESLTDRRISPIFPQSGRFWVGLTVTDSAGGSSQGYRSFAVENRRPTAQILGAPATVLAGENLQLNGAGSDDDGQPLEFRWTLTSDVDPALSTEIPGQNATFPVPAGSFGGLVVVLTTVDPLGDRGTASAVVDIIDPTAPETTTTTLPGETTTTMPGETTTTTVPATPGAPTNVRVADNTLLWDPRPGARRYLIQLEATNNGCAREQEIAVSSTVTQRALPPNPCTGAGTTARARVGAEFASGDGPMWSSWIDVPVVVK